MILRLALILMFITAVAAGGLSLLNNETAPRIAEIRRLEQEQARKEVVEALGAMRFEEVRDTTEGFTFYRAYNEKGDLVGYTALAKGKGYSSTIQTVAGFDTNLAVSGMKVTFQQETPGLGTKIEEDWFLDQFKGKDALRLAVVQDRGDIDAITGATISSRAVSNSVRQVADMLKDRITDSPAHVYEDAGTIDPDEAGEIDMEVEEIEEEFDHDYNDEEAGVDSFDDEESE